MHKPYTQTQTLTLPKAYFSKNDLSFFFDFSENYVFVYSIIQPLLWPSTTFTFITLDLYNIIFNKTKIKECTFSFSLIRSSLRWALCSCNANTCTCLEETCWSTWLSASDRLDSVKEYRASKSWSSWKMSIL